jgi:UDP-N-acetylmuramyl-tripeptide synthetase
MEVSSHGLHQGRVAGIKYDCAIFTNLTRDHLDYHATMEAYAEAKATLFEARGLEHAVVNVDDAFGAKLARAVEARGLDVITYGTGSAARLRAVDIGLSEAGVRFRVEGALGRGIVSARVLGAFNVSNLLAVLGALLAQGLSLDEAVSAVASLEPVTGRLERVGGGMAPLVVIDYAHTPDALEKALAALRPTVAAGHKLVCVFGCGGDRDPGKRPLMGAVAARLADQVVVTSDNPRGEDPHSIIAQVLEGIPGGKAEAIEDRQVAIFSAVAHATAGDVVLLAGKGHETYQEIAGTRHPFNDREVAGAALAQWEQGKA